MIRYEPPTAEKQYQATFIITCGRKKEVRIPNVTVGYLQYYLGRGFVDKCLMFGDKCALNGLNQPSFHVPLGDSNWDTAPDTCLFTVNKNGDNVKCLPFVQGASNCCLGFSLANALHHLKFHPEAHDLYSFSHNLSEWDATTQLKQLSYWVHRPVKGVKCLSVKHSKKFDGLRGLAECMEVLKKEELVVFVPQSRDGSNTHAVTCCAGLIFDATQHYPLKLSEESRRFIAGSAGFAGIWRARVFSLSKQAQKY
ncbi:unnamed protein product [Cylindrotheca closterium]|uniref:Uncharacterized protein n=1 Tax=Cylindrotheca closterium TaxID=2856 RepID=A0AAD2FYS3_9STRA|nr:unnamed protein product [Cylindrotheca closterium]